MRSMSVSVASLVALAAFGCTSPTADESRAGIGPAFTTTVGLRVGADSLSRATLLVWIAVRNDSSTPMGIYQCTPLVEVIPSPDGYPGGYVDSTARCPRGSPLVMVAPHDSLVLAHLMTADTLATFAAGTYYVNVTDNTASAVSSYPVGAVTLPLVAP